MSKRDGVEAYVLIVVEHGADEEVLTNLSKLEGIEESSLVYGEYDVHCKIRVKSMDKLREVIEKIRKLRIITTETLIAYKKKLRGSRLTNNYHRRLGHKRARH